MTDLVVSSREALVEALLRIPGERGGVAFGEPGFWPWFADDAEDRAEATHIADHLLASGVVRVVPAGKFLASDPDHETVCGCGARGNGACLPDEEAVARVKAEALEEAAGIARTYDEGHDPTPVTIAEALESRAAEYRKGERA